MEANVGSLDRTIRLILAVGFFSLFFFLSGDQRWFGLIGFVPLVTASIKWCPLYSLFGIRSCAR